jgi:hypothetical protein
MTDNNDKSLGDPIKFTIGGAAMVVSGLDEGWEGNPIDNCTLLRRRGRHGMEYLATRHQALLVLNVVESCPAYSPQGEGGGGGEGFGGDYMEVAAVRRASDSLRKALGMSLRGYRRVVRRRRRRAVRR